MIGGLWRRRPRRPRRALALAAVMSGTLVAGLSTASAHELRPIALDVTELDGGRYEVQLSLGLEDKNIQIVFPESCRREASATESRFVLDCGPSGLAGRTLTAKGLSPLRQEVLVRVLGKDGGLVTGLLTAARPELKLPEKAGDRGTLATFTTYLGAGAQHFFTGADHMFFVLGLLLSLRGRGALVRAITAFTVAHSVTLGLSVTSLVKLPSAPVEAMIALSVVAVAREIVRPSGPETTLVRRPWLFAFLFGLLHGLGFASGLLSFRVAGIGLATALLGFNVGLEAAQLGLVALALFVGRGLGPWVKQRPLWTKSIPAYGMGSIAAAWVLERTLAFAY